MVVVVVRVVVWLVGGWVVVWGVLDAEAAENPEKVPQLTFDAIVSGEGERQVGRGL